MSLAKSKKMDVQFSIIWEAILTMRYLENARSYDAVT